MEVELDLQIMKLKTTEQYFNKNKKYYKKGLPINLKNAVENCLKLPKNYTIEFDYGYINIFRNGILECKADTTNFYAYSVYPAVKVNKFENSIVKRIKTLNDELRQLIKEMKVVKNGK